MVCLCFISELSWAKGGAHSQLSTFLINGCSTVPGKKNVHRNALKVDSWKSLRIKLFTFAVSTPVAVVSAPPHKNQCTRKIKSLKTSDFFRAIGHYVMIHLYEGPLGTLAACWAWLSTPETSLNSLLILSCLPFNTLYSVPIVLMKQEQSHILITVCSNSSLLHSYNNSCDNYLAPNTPWKNKDGNYRVP